MILMTSFSHATSSPKAGPAASIIDADATKPDVARIDDPIVLTGAKKLLANREAAKAVTAQARAGTISTEDKSGALTQIKESSSELAAEHANSPLIQALAAQVHIESGDLAVADAYADKALALAPNDPFPMLVKGMVEHENGNYPEADRWAHQAEKAQPGHRGAWVMHKLSHGRAASAGGVEGVAVDTDARLHKAMEESAPPALKELLERDPAFKSAEDAAIRRKKANEMFGEFAPKMRVGDPQAVVDGMTKVLEVDPTHPDAQFMRGWARSTLKDYSGAEKDLTEAIHRWTAVGGTNAERTENIGRAYHARAGANLALGRPERALKDIESAMRLNPNKPMNHKTKGEILRAMGEKPEVWLAEFKKAAELDPPNYSKLFENAVAQLQQDKEKEDHNKERAENTKTLFGKAHNRLEDALERRLHRRTVPTAMGGLGALFGFMVLGMIWTRRE